MARGLTYRQRRPVAVRRVEVRPGRRTTSFGVDAGVQVGAPRVGPAAVGFLPRASDGSNISAREPAVVAQRVDVRTKPWVEPRLVQVRRMCGEPFGEGETGI